MDRHEPTSGNQVSFDDDPKVLIGKSENDLFAMLVPQNERGELHSFDGMAARGRVIFRSAFAEVKQSVCGLYKSQGSSVGNEIDLISLVAGAIAGSITIAAIPVIPLATLIVKIGLGRLCVASGTVDD